MIGFGSCESSGNFENKSANSVSIDMGGEMILGNLERFVVDEANPNNKFSRVDSIQIFGVLMDYFIPDSLKDTDLTLVFTGKMRETGSITSNISVGLTDMKDSLTAWQIILAADHVEETNKWTEFKDSINIPASANGINSKRLRIHPSKEKGAGFFDVDDLKIEIKSY
jgi:hypothetical protein